MYSDTSARRVESSVLTAGTEMNGMAAAQAPDPPLVLRLELVVQLLGDPLAQLRGERLHVKAGREPLDQRQQQHRVAQIGLDRLRDPRILDLDDHLVAVKRRRSVDLTDRRGRERALVELGEDAAERPSELVSQQPLELGERDRRDVVTQLGELGLQDVALVLGQAIELDHREHLPDLHRRPRICPSWSTSWLTSAAVRSFCAVAARSGDRMRLAARMPAQRAPWLVTRPPTRAVRAIRPVGSFRASAGGLVALVGHP